MTQMFSSREQISFHLFSLDILHLSNTVIQLQIRNEIGNRIDDFFSYNYVDMYWQIFHKVFFSLSKHLYR